VKRALAGSGLAPVASGTGAEAPAGAGCVGTAPMASGMSRRRPRARARARAGREVAGSCLGGGGWSYASDGREDRENEPTRVRGRRLKSFISDGP
jgi:hypothetical protein